MAQLLLATGKVDANLRNENFDVSPLSYATMEGHGAVVKLLLAADDIDVDSKDRSCQTTMF